MLTEQEKREAEQHTIKKIEEILKVNELSIIDLNPRMLISFIMVYQQGIKDAKGLLDHP